MHRVYLLLLLLLTKLTQVQILLSCTTEQCTAVSKAAFTFLKELKFVGLQIIKATLTSCVICCFISTHQTEKLKTFCFLITSFSNFVSHPSFQFKKQQLGGARVVCDL